MKKETTLIFLSSCAIDGQGVPDPFLLQELPWLQRHFDRVLLVSYYGTADLTQLDLAGTGQRQGPDARIQVSSMGLSPWSPRLRALLDGAFWGELVRLIRRGLFSPARVGKLLLFAIRGQKLHRWLERLLAGCRGEVTLYAFWMSYEAYAAALSKRKHPGLRFVARGHAFDIDAQRNPMNPYLMKRFTAGQADGLYLISAYAKEQFLAYMPGLAEQPKLRVVGIGSRGDPVVPIQEPRLSGKPRPLQLVSCATLSEIKQVPVLVDALAAWDGPAVHWTHLGGGPEEASLRAYAADKLGGNGRVSYEISGPVPNEQVQRVYGQTFFDLFVNTSRMEGTPVSIMEAMRFGIPVIAPRVGGIPEMVDGAVGWLYDPKEGAQGVLRALAAFVALPEDKVRDLREEAQARWRKAFRCESLLPLIFPEAVERDEEGRPHG